MRQLCMRSACNGPAVVLVIMNHSELTFTVRDPGEIDGPGRVVLCETHLDRMKAPLGWTIIEERVGGDVVAFERPLNRLDKEEAPLQTITEATHPLRSRSAESAEDDSSVEELKPSKTPLLARAFLGVDRHPASTTGSSSIDEDSDIEWDQRDLHDEHDEQMSLDDMEPYEPDPA